MKRETDVIVVGSGATGSWAAKVLTESDMSVLLLEAGARGESVDASEKRDRARQNIQSTCYAYSDTTRHLFVDDLDCPYQTPADKPYRWIRMRAVGGRMALWARVALRMSDQQFKAASSDGHGVDWPIGYADLKPHYSAIESFVGVAGIAENYDDIPDGEFVPTTLAEPARAFRAALQKKWPERRLTALRHVYPRGPGARSAGMQTSPHVCGTVPSALASAERTGRLHLRSGAVVSRVITNGAGTRASGVEFVDVATNRRYEAHAPVVLLCASTIETTRILLNSTSPAHPDGIGNSSGVLGTYLTEHTNVSAMGRRAGRVASSGEIYIPNFRNRSGTDQKFARGYGIQGYIVPGADDSTWCMLGSFGEAIPRRHNHITASATLKDRWGIPAPRISCEFAENEIEMAKDQAEQLRSMMSQAGFDIVHVSGLGTPGASIHELGSARMGSARESSVLNPNNQVWDVPNVFVTDGAAFPSAGFQNPTLTMMALTGRACRYIGHELRRGSFD
jgi:choline dehydrogenase-like flavoprotein